MLWDTTVQCTWRIIDNNHDIIYAEDMYCDTGCIIWEDKVHLQQPTQERHRYAYSTQRSQTKPEHLLPVHHTHSGLYHNGWLCLPQPNSRVEWKRNYMYNVIKISGLYVNLRRIHGSEFVNLEEWLELDWTEQKVAEQRPDLLEKGGWRLLLSRFISCTVD